MGDDEGSAETLIFPEIIPAGRIQIPGFRCNILQEKGREGSVNRGYLSQHVQRKGFMQVCRWLDDHRQLYAKMRSGVRMGALNRMLECKTKGWYIPGIHKPVRKREGNFYNAPLIFQELIFIESQVKVQEGVLDSRGINMD